jgi:hypothetical protein
VHCVEPWLATLSSAEDDARLTALFLFVSLVLLSAPLFSLRQMITTPRSIMKRFELVHPSRITLRASTAPISVHPALTSQTTHSTYTQARPSTKHQPRAL